MTNDIVYDVRIKEVAKILDKSDRQVRRYVKAKKLSARPVRVDGHIQLMFNREQVNAFRQRLLGEETFGDPGHEIIADTHLIEDKSSTATHEEPTPVGVADSTDVGKSDAVKYVIDALREQIGQLREENRDLHYQLEQRSGQVGFLQGKVETLQEELKMLAPAPESQDEIIQAKPWYRRIFRRD